MVDEKLNSFRGTRDKFVGHKKVENDAKDNSNDREEREKRLHDLTFLHWQL